MASAYHAATACLSAAPVPYLPQVAAPAARLGLIAQGIEFSLANAKTSCSYDEAAPERSKLNPLGRQVPGFRFLIGVTSLADARRLRLGAGHLQIDDARCRPV